MPKYLLIGPMLRPDGCNLGGATISLADLINYLKNENLSIQTIDTKRFNVGWKKILNPIFVLFRFLKMITETDIVFVNVSQFGTKTVAPVLYILTRLFGKKFVFRPFGGAMQDHYEKYAGWQKRLFHKTLLQSDIFYLQTRQLINYFAPQGKNVRQLSTSRPAPSPEFLRSDRPFAKRFIFLGHINEDKGTDSILAAAAELGSDYTVHLYGAIHDTQYKKIFTDDTHYRGVLPREKVAETLREYDVLILPTHYRGEGYPGAIIEAYALGLPVISTAWRAVPEIIEEGKTGFIIPVKSPTALAAAMRKFTPENYPEFTRNARAYFLNNFVLEAVLGKVKRETEELMIK